LRILCEGLLAVVAIVDRVPRASEVRIVLFLLVPAWQHT
jgi:hypothetical protein